MKLKETEVKTIDRAIVIIAATELNRVLELEKDEKINVKPVNKNGLDDATLLQKVTAAYDLVEAEDFLTDPEDAEFKPFSDEAVKAFEQLGFLIPKKPAPIVTDEQGKKVKKEKKAKATKVTRYQVFPLVFSDVKAGESIELKELIKKVDEMYGSHNEAECGQAMGRCIQLVVGLGLAKYEGDKLTKVAAA